MEQTEKLFTLPKRESNVDLVINRIKYLLLSKKLLPGSRLPSEMELANSLSVSRSTIREAMKILSAFGIVEIRRGDGTYVATSVSDNLFEPFLFSLILSHPDKKNLRELRALIELGIVQLIVDNAEEQDLESIQEQVDDMEGKIQQGEGNAQILTECDLNFHRALGRATRNELLEKLYTFILDFFATSIGKTHENESSGLVALNVHKKILNALKKRDVEQGRSAIEESMTIWTDLLQKENATSR